MLSIKGTDEWGNSGSNGGNVTFKATKENLTGDIEVDKISTLKLTLFNSKNFRGALLQIFSLKDKETTIHYQYNSYYSAITRRDTFNFVLSDEDSDYSNIDFNGYKLYVNGKAIN